MENTYYTLIINSVFGEAKTLRTNLLPKHCGLEFDSIKLIVDRNPGMEYFAPYALTDNYQMGNHKQTVFRHPMPVITNDFDNILQAVCDMPKKLFNGEPVKIKVDRIDISYAEKNQKFRFELAKDNGEWNVTLTKIHRKGRWHSIKGFDRNQFEDLTKPLVKADISLVTCEVTDGNQKRWCKSMQMLKDQMKSISEY